MRIKRAQLRGVQLGHLPDTRPLVDRLALGGHAFVPGIDATATAPAIWRCHRCNALVPFHALTERAWSRYTAHRCPGLLPAVPRETS